MYFEIWSVRLEWHEKLCIFIQISLKFVPEGSIENKSAIIGLSNGLALHRLSAITWTNEDTVHWCIYKCHPETMSQQTNFSISIRPGGIIVYTDSWFEYIPK